MKKTFLIIASLMGLTAYSRAQDSTHTENYDPLKFEASYIGDNINNLSGGIKTGSCYLGMANLRLDFDFEKARLWKGGQFYINAANTHGGTPSSDLLGDMQVVSNIEAGDHTYIQEFWFKQAIGKLEFILGLQDLNIEFANSEHGALFLNSSFGVLPIISNNFAAPIFPLTTLGLTTKWNISENSSWINALYDGSPSDFDYNPYNVKWQFISGDGLLAISEYQYNTAIKDRAGTYKIGVFSHSHIIEQNLNRNFPDSLNHNLFGIYAHADQILWEQNMRSFGLFSQLGYSPTEASTIDFYLGLGLNYAGLFSKKGKDVLGLAIAHEQFKKIICSETTIELTYQYQISKNLFIQPDIQYIK